MPTDGEAIPRIKDLTFRRIRIVPETPRATAHIGDCGRSGAPRNRANSASKSATRLRSEFRRCCALGISIMQFGILIVQLGILAMQFDDLVVQFDILVVQLEIRRRALAG